MLLFVLMYLSIGLGKPMITYEDEEDDISLMTKPIGKLNSNAPANDMYSQTKRQVRNNQWQGFIKI